MIARVFRCSVGVTDPGASTLESGQPLIIVVGVRSTRYLRPAGAAPRFKITSPPRRTSCSSKAPIKPPRETRHPSRYIVVSCKLARVATNRPAISRAGSIDSLRRCRSWIAGSSSSFLGRGNPGIRNFVESHYDCGVVLHSMRMNSFR